jgi:NADP-dependent 3-hydroxy acid dehydrogenase YdfG
MQDLKNRIILITGAGSGFGKATAEKFYRSGAIVVATGRDIDKLDIVKKEIGDIDIFRADVKKTKDWEKLHTYIKEKYGKLDILVNNAGGAVTVKETVEQRMEDIDSIISLNLNSVVYGCKLFGKLMKENNHGTILNISSACATEAWPNFSIYAAAKAGVVALSKGLYTELRPFNVRVTAVIPGAGRTNFSKNAGLPEPDSPFKLEAQDMAEVIHHICSMPQHIYVEEYRFWGMDQEIIPL